MREPCQISGDARGVRHARRGPAPRPELHSQTWNVISEGEGEDGVKLSRYRTGQTRSCSETTRRVTTRRGQCRRAVPNASLFARFESISNPRLSLEIGVGKRSRVASMAGRQGSCDRRQRTRRLPWLNLRRSSSAASSARSPSVARSVSPPGDLTGITLA